MIMAMRHHRGEQHKGKQTNLVMLCFLKENLQPTCKQNQVASKIPVLYLKLIQRYMSVISQKYWENTCWKTIKDDSH